MYIGESAERFPDTLACVIDDGVEQITYAELDEQSNALAHGLASLGLTEGDTVAVILENSIPFAIAWWAAMRSGMYVTPINWHLTGSEVRYIVENSGAKAIITSPSTSAAAASALSDCDGFHEIQVGAAAAGNTGVTDFHQLVGDQPTHRIARELAGGPMFYSSGTTGRPKGVRPKLSGLPPSEFSSVSHLIMTTFGISHGDHYLSPAPLYHSAPSSWSFGAHTVGCDRRDHVEVRPEQRVAAPRAQSITASQWVPTMFRVCCACQRTSAPRTRRSHRAAYPRRCPVPGRT